MSDSVICIENLEFSYQKGPMVLKIDSLRIEKGEKIFLYGPSGSGKTTLLSLFDRHNFSTKKGVEVFGHDLSSTGGRKRDQLRGQNCGYIFQSFQPGAVFILIRQYNHGCQLNKQRMARLDDSLKVSVQKLADSLGIRDVLYKNVSEISVGQQQRVAAKRAFQQSPRSTCR